MATYYGLCSTTPRPLQEDSLLFTTKLPEIPGTHLIDLRKMKGWVNLGATQRFEHWTPELGIQHLNHQAMSPYFEKCLSFNFL